MYVLNSIIIRSIHVKVIKCFNTSTISNGLKLFNLSRYNIGTASSTFHKQMNPNDINTKEFNLIENTFASASTIKIYKQTLLY